MPSKKDDLPAMPTYWGDWFKAMDLMSLPRETRCVWFEMIGRMWESNERGYLTINGKPMSDFAIANVLGFGSDVPSYKKHEKILEDAGIFSRRESDGAIYSRKIIRLLELSKKRKEAGALGAAKTWKNAKAKVIASAKANGIANTETEDETEDEDKNRDKKRIVKERKRVEFVPPTREEAAAFFVSKGFPGSLGERAWDGYDAAGWIDSQGTKIKNWKQKMIFVWMKDENKVSAPGNGMLSKAGQQSMKNAEIAFRDLEQKEQK